MAAWHLFATAYHSILFPTPFTTFKTLISLLEGGLLTDVKVSMGRVLGGFVIGGVLGILLGLGMGAITPIRTLFDPYVQFLRFIPPIAWFSPVVIWFGIGEEAKLALIAYTTTFVVVLNTIVGVEAVPTRRLLVAKMFGAGPVQTFSRIIVPSTIPYMLTGLRIAMGNSFMTLVAAEMLAANQGIGFVIINARIWSATDQTFAGMFVLGLMGYATDLILRLAIRLFANKYMPSHVN